MKGAFIGDRYEIIEEIGSGGMAIVYKARCRLLNRNVAIKVLRPEFQNDKEFLRRFATEAQAAASLSHPNIVSIFDVGSHNNMNYIVMEYIEGVPFNEYLANKGALPVLEALDYSQQIVSALSHAHSKKIIHRDIKPHNIIMTENHTLKITDFGLARAVSSSTTISGGAMGSVHYASPEQARGGFTDNRSDIYSLGIMMYEMFTGRLPFDADTAIGVAMKHLQEPAIMPRSLRPDIPEQIEGIIMKAMEKDSRQRYTSASDLLEDVKAIRLGGTVAPHQEEDEDKFKTKKLPHIESAAKIPQNTEEQKKPREKDEKKDKKADALAVILAVLTAIVIMSGIGVLAAKLFFSDGIQRAKVPKIEGKNIEEIMKTIDSSKFTIETADTDYSETDAAGIIISQQPKAGEKVEIPAQIKVVVSLGSGVFEMGDYRDKEYEKVAEELNRIKANYEKIEEYDDDVPEGCILRQVPAAKTRMNIDDKITLYVSLGPKVQKVKVPKIVGMTQNEATIELYENNLTPGNIEKRESTEPQGTVISQSVSEGTEVDEKTQINFVVSLGRGGTHTLSLTLPRDGRETVNVRVMVDGSVAYQKKHSASEGKISVKLQGEGEAQVDVYYDDVLQNSSMIKF